MLKTLALLPLLASGSSVFTWTDPDGTVHYTDDLSRVPKGLRPGEAKKASSEPLPFPLEGVTEAQWANDVTACREALATVREVQRDLRKAEVELIARREKYRPCQAFNDLCYSPSLTRAAWEKECQRVPAACSVNVDGQAEYVEAQRDRLEAFVTWLDGMAKWGCARSGLSEPVEDGPSKNFSVGAAVPPTPTGGSGRDGDDVRGHVGQVDAVDPAAHDRAHVASPREAGIGAAGDHRVGARA